MPFRCKNHRRQRVITTSTASVCPTDSAKAASLSAGSTAGSSGSMEEVGSSAQAGNGTRRMDDLRRTTNPSYTSHGLKRESIVSGGVAAFRQMKNGP